MLNASSSLNAQDVWTLTSADFTEQRVTLLDLNDREIRIRNIAGETAALPWDRLLELDRGGGGGGSGRSMPSGHSLILFLHNNDRLAGEPVAIADETLTWQTPFGPTDIPLRDAKSIVRGADEMDDSAAPPPEDTIILSNGDRAAGVIGALDRQSIHLSPAGGGEQTALDWNAIESVRFAGAGARSASQPDSAVPSRAFRVTLLGDSRLTVRSIALAGDQLQLRALDTRTRSVPLKSVQSIEQLNGPIVWLTALAPTENVHEPYFAGIDLPARFDRNVGGTSPVRAINANRVARAGIGVASRSRISWKIPSGFEAFRAQFAVDGNLPYANAIVRVKLDNKTAYELTDVTASTDPQLVIVPLKNASTLTLEVDYGKTLDVQDRINWIEPALLKRMPTTQPSR
jgi:hypothetical protein